MKITPEIKTIIKSISGRSNKYGEFGLSRHEYEKFGLTEMKLRTIINNLVKEGYIEKIRCEYFSFLPNMIRRRNIYKATQLLIDLAKSFVEAIKDMNEKIITWCKNQNPMQTMKEYGIEIFRGGRIGSKQSKETINYKTGAITNWKTGRKTNIFNYIRDKLNQTTREFFLNNVSNY